MRRKKLTYISLQFSLFTKYKRYILHTMKNQHTLYNLLQNQTESNKITRVI